MKEFGKFSAGAWLLFFTLYLLLAGEVNVAEVVAGASSACFSLVVVRLLRGKFKRPLLMKLQWFPLLWRIPWATLTETFLIFKAMFCQLLGKPREGTFIHHPFAAEKDDRDSARRALMTFGVCVTPNSYLVYYDSEKRRVLVRQLVGKDLSPVDRKFVELP